MLSPSSRSIYSVLERAVYEQSGAAHYWVVDPDEVSVTAWSLHAGQYGDPTVAVGDEVCELPGPSPVTLSPAALLR